MTTTTTPKMPETLTPRARRRELARYVGAMLNERRRTVARSLASEFAASEADFARWVLPARPTRE